MADAVSITRRSALLGALAGAAVLPVAAAAAASPLGDGIPPPAPLRATSDPVLTVLAKIAAEERRLDGLPGDQAEDDLGTIGRLDEQLIHARATTVPGAIASLQHARHEFMTFVWDGRHGHQVIIASINSALAVLEGSITI